MVTGRGVSYCKYELVRTYIAAVAEVEVKRSTGEIRVTHFYIAHDCGQIINPDGIRNQIEGNIIQTVSRTLKEELKFDRSTVTSLDWASYPILTFPEVPEIVIDLIDRPSGKALGRRRAVGGSGAVGDLERGVRCDRRAAALGAVHARQGQKRIARSLSRTLWIVGAALLDDSFCGARRKTWPSRSARPLCDGSNRNSRHKRAPTTEQRRG